MEDNLKLNLKKKKKGPFKNITGPKTPEPKVHPMEYRKTVDLEFLENNPRYIEEEDLEELQQSLKEDPLFFEAKPAILSNRTGLLVIIAGNQRVKAAIRNGDKEVPTILMEGLTEDQERRIALKDNIHAGKWDNEVLKKAWSDMPLEDWNILPKEVEEEQFEGAAAGTLKKAELAAVTKTHVLFSFPSDKMAELQPLLQKIADIKGVEYEQTSN